MDKVDLHFLANSLMCLITLGTTLQLHELLKQKPQSDLLICLRLMIIKGISSA